MDTSLCSAIHGSPGCRLRRGNQWPVGPSHQRWRWDLNPRKGRPFSRFRGALLRPLGHAPWRSILGLPQSAVLAAPGRIREALRRVCGLPHDRPCGWPGPPGPRPNPRHPTSGQHRTPAASDEIRSPAHMMQGSASPQGGVRGLNRLRQPLGRPPQHGTSACAVGSGRVRRLPARQRSILGVQNDRPDRNVAPLSAARNPMRRPSPDAMRWHPAPDAPRARKSPRPADRRGRNRAGWLPCG